MQKPKILQSALASISGELRKVRTEYENTLAEIGKRKDEIKRLLDMPVNLDDFGEYLKKSIRIILCPFIQQQLTRYQTMQQSIIRPKQAAALFGVSLSTLWNWNNPKHRLSTTNRTS